MDEKLIIDLFVAKIKTGKLALTDVPIEFREKVKEGVEKNV